MVRPASRQWLNIEAAVSDLPEEKRRKFFELHSRCKETEVMKIFDVNSFGIEPFSNEN